MGASSVTGVSGPGAAINKGGPHNDRANYLPLTGPRVIMAGSVTLDGGGASRWCFLRRCPVAYTTILMP